MPTILLNWRLWVTVGFVALFVALGLKVYKAGRDEGLAQLAEYKNEQLRLAIKEQQARDDKKAELDAANQKVGEINENVKKITLDGIKSLTDARLRLNATIASGHSPASSSPTSAPVTYATTKDQILGECTAAYTEVAGDAQQLSDQVTGLQKYIGEVVQHGSKGK
jgi:hypothetical protein